MRKLMRDIVAEQEGKRKSEMDVLQSQINPHFLYNALDSIIAMIDSKRYEGAVTMITALAQLFPHQSEQGEKYYSGGSGDRACQKLSDYTKDAVQK